MTYEEFWIEVLRIHGYNKKNKLDELRLGQRFCNLLPSRISRALVASTFDPFFEDRVSQEAHDLAKAMWEEE